MNYTVYLRTNLVNGKQYVGQTSNFRVRNNQFNCLKARYANKCIMSDREKYGIDNFKVEILAIVETREEAWKLEEKYIKEFNTRFPNGYNRAYGGKTNKGGNEGYTNNNGYKKGHEPWNKGIKGTHFSPDTEFKGLQVVKLKNGVLIKVYNRLLDAAEDNVGCYTSSIAQCCKGNRKTAGGFEWMYKEDYEKMVGKVITAPPTIV